jgi:hypothetical protein
MRGEPYDMIPLNDGKLDSKLIPQRRNGEETILGESPNTGISISEIMVSEGR